MIFYTRKDRDRDREMFLEAIRAIASPLEKQLDIMREQLRVQGDFMRMLTTDEAPVSRTLRDEDEFQMELDREKAVMRWHGEES